MRETSLSTRIIATVVVVFVLLFAPWLVLNINKSKQLLEAVYLEKAKTIAYALDASIKTEQELKDHTQMLANIQKMIWLDPDIISIAVNLPDADQLVTFIADQTDRIGQPASAANTKAYQQGLLLHEIILRNQQRLLRIITPIHIAKQQAGTYQIDITLENIDLAIADSLKASILSEVLIVLIFILVLAWFLRKTVIEPLQRINFAVDMLAGGIPHYVEVSSSDEIGKLANAFNQMTTELKHKGAELHQSEAKHRLLFETMAQGVIYQDKNATIISMNPAAYRILGEHPESVWNCQTKVFQEDGGKYTLINHPAHIALQSGTAVNGMVMGFNHPGDEKLHWISIHAIPQFRDGEAQAFQVYSTFTDITQGKRAAEQIEQLAYYDVLTGLPNRRLLMQYLQNAVSYSKQHSCYGALLYFDLDHFKNVNDSLGHRIGDGLLQEVAQRLRTILRAEDKAARLGGDEFVVLLNHVNSDIAIAFQHTRSLAGRIQTDLSRPFTILDHHVHITASIGITLFPESSSNTEDILKQADTAMYQAKSSGRNALRFFLPSMQQTIEQRISLQNSLRGALVNNELTLHFQPQVNAARQIIGIEALVRWQRPGGQLIYPDEFLQVAEETGMIIEIGQWVLQQACQQFCRWSRAGLLSPQTSIAVNVSPTEFCHPEFITQVVAILEKTELEAKRLEIELTEGTLINDIDDTVAKMNALKAFGINFSIDDFGTGFSSLAYLKRLPLDKLKIDRSFVSDITNNASDAAIVDTIIAVAQHTGLTVIAEGIETEEMFHILHEKGCQTYQGYYFGTPMSAVELTKVLEAQKKLALEAFKYTEQPPYSVNHG